MKQIFILLFILLLPLGIKTSKGSGDDLESDIEKSAKEFQDLSPINLEDAPKKDTHSKIQKEEKSFFSFLDMGHIEKMKKDLLEKFLKENPFSTLSVEQAESLILAGLNGKPVGDYVKNSPRLLRFIAEVLTDKTAIPHFFGILAKDKELKIYGISILVLFILSFILNIMWNKEGSFFKRLYRRFMISMGALGVNLLLVFIFFRENFSEIIKIAIKNFS